MKTFLKLSYIFLPVLTLMLAFASCNPATEQSKETQFKAKELFPEPPRPEGQSDVIELRCDPIDTVHIAFIGLGGRGKGAVRRYTYLEGVKIVALCDLVQENLDKSQEILHEAGLPEADV